MAKMVKISKSEGRVVATIFAATVCIPQIVGLIRYLQRLPEDWVGVGLYSASIAALAFAALGFYIQ